MRVSFNHLLPPEEARGWKASASSASFARPSELFNEGKSLDDEASCLRVCLCDSNHLFLTIGVCDKAYEFCASTSVSSHEPYHTSPIPTRASSQATEEECEQLRAELSLEREKAEELQLDWASTHDMFAARVQERDAKIQRYVVCDMLECS